VEDKPVTYGTSPRRRPLPAEDYGAFALTGHGTQRSMGPSVRYAAVSGMGGGPTRLRVSPGCHRGTRGHIPWASPWWDCPELPPPSLRDLSRCDPWHAPVHRGSPWCKRD
jgi:hypothetical protein